MKIKFIIFTLFIMMQGCSKLDDYMLGKDNTPRPKELKEIQEKINVVTHWTIAIGKAHKSTEYLRLKPAIRGGIIYTADVSGLVQAVNKNNGEIKWTKSLKHGLVSGPAVVNGYIALGTNDASVVVLSQASGKKLWQTKVAGEVLSPPVITHKKVIVKTINGTVYAFNLSDGKQLWMTEHGSPSLILKASSSPIVMGNLLIIGFSDGKLDALEIDTGRTLWQRSIVYAAGSSDVERLVDIDADPLIEQNVIYLATYQGFIGALSLADGQFIWKKPSSVYKNMILSGDTLYATDSHDVIWSLDKHNGRVNWTQAALKARILTEPLLINGDIVVGDRTGYLHFLDSQTGEILSRSKVSGSVSISPSVIGSKLYVLTDNGMLNQLSVSKK